MQDPDAARAWLEEQDISDGWRQQILNNWAREKRWVDGMNAERDE